MSQKTNNIVDGEEITLGGATFTLPPLPLARLKHLGVLLTGGDPSDPESGYTDALTDAVYYSLRRNYPDISRELVEDNIDLVNFQDVLQKFMKVNNLNAKGEAGKQANPAETEKSTGTE